MEVYLRKSLLTHFADNAKDKHTITEWLQKNGNDGTARRLIDFNKGKQGDSTDIHGESLVVCGLALMMLAATPMAIGVGATIALLGEGIRFMVDAIAVESSFDSIRKTARFDTAIDKRNADRLKTQENKAVPTLKPNA